MIRKLRLKFICVNMLIVTLMLTAIFGMVYHLTRQGLETQSEAMLQSVASDAFHPNRPGRSAAGGPPPLFRVGVGWKRRSHRLRRRILST